MFRLCCTEAVRIHRVTDDDRPWIAETIASEFASSRVVSRGRIIDDASLLDGFLVELDGHSIGVVALARDRRATRSSS